MDNSAVERLERVMQAGFETLADLQRETNARLDQHEGLLVELTAQVRILNKRFDNFLTGEHRQSHQDLQRRVERIEEHLGLSSE